MLEALCRQSSTTLDIVHAEDGPPITQRTSGLVSLAAIEQVNLKQASAVSRKFERQHLSAVGRPPLECRTFYVAAEHDRVQEDAMRIAQAQHLPTINGDSGLVPQGWGLGEPYKAGYEEQATCWAVRRGIAEGLCRVDVGSGTWTVFDVDRDWSCTPGGCERRISFDQTPEFEINLEKGGNWALFTDNNWAGAEDWGQWTRAMQAALSFSVGAPRDLVVALSIGSLLSATAPKQSVWVEANQCRVVGFDFVLAHGPGLKPFQEAFLQVALMLTEPSSCASTQIECEVQRKSE